jgi:hypothetical protein
MTRCAVAALGAWLCTMAPAALFAQDPAPAPAQASPVVRSLRFTGNKEISDQAVRDTVHVAVDQPFTETPDQVAARLQRQYREDGYTFARVKGEFDAASSVLALTIDEGVIEAVEFEGVDQTLVRRFGEEFALRAGDVFNSRRARQALDVLLRPTRGAVSRRRTAFDLVDRNGQRILVVGLREPPGRFRLLPDFGEREDWFSSVDGFVPSLGMGIALFDHDRFNHAYVAGHVSYKTATARAGYALGFERPLFGRTKVYLGGELHDLTATDDRWQASSDEASLDAAGARRSYRDYYRRRGVQINAAVRIHPQVEALFAWRGERQEPLAAASQFSVWNGDESFRPNLSARDGQLNAVVIGASADGRGFDRESLDATYRRHQLETPFGERLNHPDGSHDGAPIWRIDWTSEVSAPGALGSDFDFRRHIVSGRARMLLSEHEELGVRAIGGWSEGVLPPQREFAIGGIGSVHGYEFKEAVGDTLALVNLEYLIGWRGGLQGIGFFDAGHVTLRSAQAGLQPRADTPWLKGIGWGIGLGGFRVDFGYKLDAVPSSLQVLVRFGRTF